MKCPYCHSNMNKTVIEKDDEIITEYVCSKCGYREKYIRRRRPRKIKPYLPTPPYPRYDRWRVWGEPTPYRPTFWRKG